MWPLLAVAAEVETHRYALLVGTNDGGGDRTPLRYAHDDALAVADVLTGLGGVAEERTDILSDPGRAEVRNAFEALRARIGADAGRTEVVFYYSGHSDEEGLRLGEELLEWRELRDLLDDLGADLRLAILDSCASGSLILAKGGTAAPPFVTPGGRIEGFAYITSSSPDEVSQEGERIGGSYFTHYLTTGLLGAADRSGDGQVTLNEAYLFAREETLSRTERTSHGPQHANYAWQLEGSGELVLTDLARRSSTLVIGADVVGRTSVRDEHGVLVAELEARGEEVTFALAPGLYRVTVAQDGSYLEGDVVLDDGASSVLGVEGLVSTLGESTITRGGPPVHDLDTFVLAPVVGRSPALDGFGFGTLSYTVEGEARGVATSLLLTDVDDLRGWQAAFGLNVGRQGSGVQTALGANVLSQGFDGAQVTTGVNVAANGINGVQAAVGANVAPGGVHGLQLGTANLAGGTVEGVQLGVVDVAGDVDGLQLSIVNVASEVRGVQLGIVNVAKDVHGVPIGLLSFVEDGRHAVLVGGASNELATVEVKLGDAFHTALAAGWRPDRAITSRGGFGVHGAWEVGKAGELWADLDAGVSTWMPIGAALARSGLAFGQAHPTVLQESRVTLGWNPVPAVAPYVGVGVSARLVQGGVPTPDGVAWPVAFAGVQLF